MEATFKLDPCLTLVIRSVGVRDASEPGVHVGLKHVSVGGINTESDWHQEKWFSSAEARAIGSAIIGAAVSARE